MGTKNDPGPFDCYSNAELDEPMFILLGRDPLAHMIVRLWIATREKMGNKWSESSKLDNAHSIVHQLETWAREKRGDRTIDDAREAFRATLQQMADELG